MKYLRAVSSRMLAGTLAPMLNTSDLDRPDVALDLLDERDHLLLLARVAAERTRAAAGALDLAHQRLELVQPSAAPGQATKPSRAKRAAIAPPVASPAPTMSATLSFVLLITSTSRGCF